MSALAYLLIGFFVIRAMTKHPNTKQEIELEKEHGGEALVGMMFVFGVALWPFVLLMVVGAKVFEVIGRLV